MRNGSAPGTSPDTPKRFVPSGVDAQSWMGFEQRIQDRRYNALLETMKAAVAAGDPAAARAALDEARELRPTASELDAYELRISGIPLRPVSATTLNVGQWRAVSAVALLLAGIGFVTGIDYLRSEGADPPLAVEVAAPSLIRTDSIVAEPVVTRPLAARPAPTLPAVEVTVEDEAPRGTSGRTDFERAGEAETVAIPAPLRPARRDDEGAPLQAGETPDDFVSPSRTIAPMAMPSSVPADVLPPRSSGLVAMPSPAAAAAAAAAAARLEERRVSDVLNAYAQAYGRLDASAARAVWPSVDERALARAFASLESQNVSFEACDIELNGATANASCRGQASYVGKVGSSAPRVEARQWRFQLRQDEGGWKIQRAEARAQ